MSSLVESKSLLRATGEIARDYAFHRGLLGPPKLVAKLVLLGLRYRAHRRWMRVIGGTTTRSLLAKEPRTAYRHASKYLFAGLSWRERLHLMSAHYAFLNARHGPGFFHDVISRDGLVLWRHATADSSTAITLHGPAHHREGDLMLHFALDGVTIFRLGFSVLPATFFAEGSPDGDEPRAHVLYIAQVQGVAGEADRLRLATHLCVGIAPQDLLMSALAGIAEAWCIDHCLAATVARHLSAAKMSATATPFDYPAFWDRYHAVPRADGQIAMRIPYVQKPILQIVTRHRKRTLVKREFKRLLVAAVSDTVSSRPARG